MYAYRAEEVLTAMQANEPILNTLLDVAALFTDRILHTDVEQYKDEQGNYFLPDGLVYMAAYLPALTSDISDQVMERVYNEIDDCIKHSMKTDMLMRCREVGEKWRVLCSKLGWHEKQHYFDLIVYKSSVALCNFYIRQIDAHFQLRYPHHGRTSSEG